MGYTIYIGDNPPIYLETKEEYDEWNRKEGLKRLNEKEYARQHKSEKVRFIFHGGCLSCVTPLHYGIGNCLGCCYFEDRSKPSLKIEDFSK